MATTEMSDDGVQFFEGVEKLLEIWFTNSAGDNKNADLRKIPRYLNTTHFFNVKLHKKHNNQLKLTKIL